MKAWLRFAGKGERKVAAVFGVSPAGCDRAVRYLRRELPAIPVWLFTVETPGAETAGMCERVIVDSDSLALLVAAEKELWGQWVAITVGAWVGGHGRWPVKIAPLAIPPFRALLMNELGDFFPGRIGPIAAHARRRARDVALAAWRRAVDVARGLALLGFAWVAQWSSPVSRWAFRRNLARAGETLVTGAAARGNGDDCLVLRYAGRRWDWSDFERRIRESSARFVRLAQAPYDDGLEELMPLFADPRTFAVARQDAFRLWHPVLFATAPFRQLQPGAASRVLAPVSHSIVIERAKLVEMGGIPRTVVPGSALYLMFWRAAAAGWISFAGGGGRRLEEWADRPYEEAEFVARVLADATLKKLRPREAELARGNISFAVAGARGFTPGRPRVLVVSPYLPYPLSHGGAVRIYNLCRALSKRVELVLACFREKEDSIEFEKLHEVFREVYVVDIDERKSKDRALPEQVRGHVSASMRELIGEICREKKIDLLQIEFTHLAQFRDAAPATPAILVEHDLTFILYGQLAEREKTAAARAEHERWLEFERRWLKRYDAVWTMSEEDRASAIAEGSAAERTFVVANGVDVERFTPRAGTGEGLEIFYVGSFRHLPNLLGFERLRHEIMPAVWTRFPEARLRVVAGPEPERYWREFLRREYPRMEARIVVHGFVEDLRPLYAGAAAVVIPLAVSAGTNIKVLEAMACGKAVVSTPAGCAGLGLEDGRDALIRKESGEIAEALCALLADAERRGAMGAAARRSAVERFSWESIAEAAHASYLETVKAR